MTRRSAVAALSLLLGACDYQTYQSTFGNAATEGRQFNTLFVVFLVVCGIMMAQTAFVTMTTPSPPVDPKAQAKQKAAKH